MKSAERLSSMWPISTSSLRSQSEVWTSLFASAPSAIGRDEMLAAPGQHGRDLMPGLLQQPDQFERLVGGNSSADDQQYPRHALRKCLRPAAKSSAHKKSGTPKGPASFTSFARS